MIIDSFTIYVDLESEEMRLAASIIDKAKRTIEVSSGREIHISHFILSIFYFYFNRMLVKRSQNKHRL
jgi:hypothetical protein